MDAFQKAQQANAEDLRKAMEEQAAAATTERDRVALEREAERQRNTAKNLGNA